MIVTVTLNAALDVTYDVDAVALHESHRVRTVHSRAGGKGINVARVLAALGEPVLATGLVGGIVGRQIRQELAAARLPDALVEIAGESRRTTTVVSAEDGDATVFNEPGPDVTATEWRGFCGRFGKLVRDADVVVCSGSLPLGVPIDAYATLTGIARRHGAHVVVDADGAALLATLGAGPDVVKPNRAELAAATGRASVPEAAQSLVDSGAQAVVASLGADGLLAVTPGGTWQARPPERLSGNPTGAGDACVAALASGLVRGDAWPDLLREAVACSAAAVAAPLAGDLDVDVLRRFRPLVKVEKLDGAHADG